jgi:phosphatidylglycerophosphatase A
MSALPPTWGYIIAGFILFRIMDIVKPYPIRWIDQNVAGGYGIVLDDVLAGVYANIILQIARAFL